MTATAIRERLYQVADDEKIKAIYTLLEDQVIPQVDWSQDEDFVAELDERVRRYNEGIDCGHTWDELEAAIEERKKKRLTNKTSSSTSPTLPLERKIQRGQG